MLPLVRPNSPTSFPSRDKKTTSSQRDPRVADAVAEVASEEAAVAVEANLTVRDPREVEDSNNSSLMTMLSPPLPER